jgi:hypothetical protein
MKRYFVNGEEVIDIDDIVHINFKLSNIERKKRNSLKKVKQRKIIKLESN